MRPLAYASVILVLSVNLAGCAAVDPEGYDMEEMMADYCDDAGPRRTLSNTNIIHSWDDEATTAGHRGTVTDDVMEPDLNQARPHGC